MSEEIKDEPLEEQLKNIIRKKSEENLALRKLLENLGNLPLNTSDTKKHQKNN